MTSLQKCLGKVSGAKRVWKIVALARPDVAYQSGYSDGGPFISSGCQEYEERLHNQYDLKVVQDRFLAKLPQP